MRGFELAAELADNRRMRRLRRASLAAPVLAALFACTAPPPRAIHEADPPAVAAGWRSMGEVLSAAASAEWRTIDPANLLYLELVSGTVVIELAPQFAPRHVENLRKLLAAGHFEPARIVRSQDNYVAQWSGGGPTTGAALRLAPEFYRDARGLEFTRLDARDAYAAEVGFSEGFPVGRDAGRAWLAHCYGMLGAGRDVEPDSGNASELYVVTGHAPRHLDRNVTLLGRVIDGIEHLATLPRGTGALGFYEREDEYVTIRSLRPGKPGDPRWQALRTDSPSFAALVRARRERHEDWFVDPAGAIELCNVPLPRRRAP